MITMTFRLAMEPRRGERSGPVRAGAPVIRQFETACEGAIRGKQELMKAKTALRSSPASSTLFPNHASTVIKKNIATGGRNRNRGRIVRSRNGAMQLATKTPIVKAQLAEVRERPMESVNALPVARQICIVNGDDSTRVYGTLNAAYPMTNAYTNHAY